MKKLRKLSIIIITVVALALAMLLAACNDEPKDSGPVDYVSSLKLDFSSNTKKQEVKVRLFVDGDTTHFDPIANSTLTPYNAADYTETDGYIKARYIAINTPESTGRIEPWGKKASKFTRSKLESATSIVVESDDDKWNIDSSGSHRHVVWVWYKPEGSSDYRNLNVEILQEGLAFGSSVANNRYGKQASDAMMQARNLQLYVFSRDRDPDFPYGAATPVTLKEIRTNIEDYNGVKVSVEGVVAAVFNNSVYIEDYDNELGMYFGMSVYYGYQAGKILEILSYGNRVNVVGIVQYYEGGKTYQISDVSYDEYSPTLASNSTLISEGNTPAFTETSAHDIVAGKVTVRTEKETENEDGEIVTETETKELDYAEAIMSTSVTVKNLTVVSIYTTSEGTSKDAMSITCRAEDDTIIVIRTEVLKDENGNTITQSKYENKRITVKGIVDKYTNNQGVSSYQVRCYRADYITILD